MDSVRWTNPRIGFLTLLLLIGSACRPSIDDNAPVPIPSNGVVGDGSITSAKLADGAVTPAKLSQAYLPLAGGTLSGTLVLAGPPTSGLHAATKTYADSYLAGLAVDASALTSITNNQVLGWNAASSKWAPLTVVGAADATAIQTINVDNTAPTTAQVLVYDTAVATKWAATTIGTASIAASAVTPAKMSAGDPGASGLVLTSTGASTAAWSSWSQGNIAFATKTANYTLTSTDNIIAVNTSGANRAMTLPTAASIAGRQYTIKKIDSGAFTVTVTPNGAETIDGLTSLVLSSQWQTVTVVSDGSNWQILFQTGTQPGTLVPYGGSSVPSGWLLCNGQAVSRTTYSALFASIGTTWGVGDGSTTFNVPDMRGMFPRGTGTHGSATYSVGGSVAGPSLGAQQNDQFQGHYHYTYVDGVTGATSGGLGNLVNNGNDVASNVTRQAVTDGTNGTPRTGSETRPFNVGVNYMIKF